MTKGTTLTVMAYLAVIILVLWIIIRSPSCRTDGAMLLRVDHAQYLVPAWMGPSPSFVRELPGLEKSSFSQQNKGFTSWCQSASAAAIQVRGFGFGALPRRVRSEYPTNTSSIVRVSQLSPAIRPSGNPLAWRNIRSATLERRIVSADGNWASIFFSLNFASGPS